MIGRWAAALGAVAVAGAATAALATPASAAQENPEGAVGGSFPSCFVITQVHRTGLDDYVLRNGCSHPVQVGVRYRSGTATCVTVPAHRSVELRVPERDPVTFTPGC